MEILQIKVCAYFLSGLELTSIIPLLVSRLTGTREDQVDPLLQVLILYLPIYLSI